MGILGIIIGLVILLWVIAVASVFFGFMLMMAGLSLYQDTNDPIFLFVAGIGFIFFLPVLK